LARATAAVDELLETGLDPASSDEARTLVRGLETLGRKVDAARVEALEVIDRGAFHRHDGHYSAKVMVRHTAQLSAAEAAARAKVARALRDLPATREAYRAGAIGTDQVRRMARVHANARVRDRLPQSEQRFVTAATGGSYKSFDRFATDWVRRLDEDGTCDLNQRHHENRNARLVQDFDQSWRWEGGCGSLQGAQMHDIFQHFYQAETLADWEKARAEHGDDARPEHLPRSDGQRRADTFFTIFERAASTPPGGKAPEIVTNIVIDEATWDRHLTKLAGADVEPADPDDHSYRCDTFDGHPIEPTEAVAAALVGGVKRVVMGADRVVIDKSRKQRLFTGSARLAVQLADNECLWPGCHIPVTNCQIDHTTGWAPARGGGRTNPRNGGPACGRHNRLKERGYALWRDLVGQWHVHRPDGTRIE